MRGIARRKKLLEAARELLQTRDLDAISLGDVAQHAKVPKGSAYHFYTNIKDLYANLVVLLLEELLRDMKAPIRSRVRGWPDVMDVLIERGCQFYLRDAASRQLLIGPKTFPELKMRDRQSDVVLGRVFEDHCATYFELPPLAGRSDIFFRSVEIADLMFCLSMLDHGGIVEEMNQEAKRASVAYLASYMPMTLPKRKKRGKQGVSAS